MVFPTQYGWDSFYPVTKGGQLLEFIGLPAPLLLGTPFRFYRNSFRAGLLVNFRVTLFLVGALLTITTMESCRALTCPGAIAAALWRIATGTFLHSRSVFIKDKISCDVFCFPAVRPGGEENQRRYQIQRCAAGT